MPYALVLGDVLALLAVFYLGRLSHAFYYHLNPGWVLLYWWGSLAQVNVLLFLLLVALGITGNQMSRQLREMRLTRMRSFPVEGLAPQRIPLPHSGPRPFQSDFLGIRHPPANLNGCDARHGAPPFGHNDFGTQGRHFNIF